MREMHFQFLSGHKWRSISLKKAVGEKLRADQCLRNDFIDVLYDMDVGWSPHVVGTIG